MSAPTQTADIHWMIDATAELERLRAAVEAVADDLDCQSGADGIAFAPAAVVAGDLRRALAGEPALAAAEPGEGGP